MKFLKATAPSGDLSEAIIYRGTWERALRQLCVAYILSAVCRLRHDKCVPIAAIKKEETVYLILLVDQV